VKSHEKDGIALQAAYPLGFGKKTLVAQMKPVEYPDGSYNLFGQDSPV